MSEENRGRVPTGPLPRLFMACDVSHIPVSPPPRTQRSGPRRIAKKSPPERSFRRSRKRNGGGISGNGKRDTGLSQHPPSPRRREPSEAVRGGMRRNPRQSAVFGEAGNGTAAEFPVMAKGIQASAGIPRLPAAANPAKRSAAECEEIPARAQFSAKPETERRRGFLSWCGHGDSNPNALLHENLNLACLPISSCPQI